jgi:YHS domain-containing protein
MQPVVLFVLLVLLSAGTPTATGALQEPAVEALDGLDPVLLVGGKEVAGKSALSVTRGGFVYLFFTADTKATFERDPAAYEIQLGGLCAKMGKTAGGNPSDFIVHAGRIYIFGTDDCHKKFQAEPSKYLPPAPPPVPTTPVAAARGRQIIERAVTAVGGAARLDAVKTYVESFAQVQKRPQGDATITTRTMWSFPDRVRQERAMMLQGKTMRSATILTLQGMWFIGGQGTAYPIRAAGRPSLELDFGRHPVALLRARRSPGFRAVAQGATSVDGVKIDEVRVIHGATDVVLAVRADGRIHSTTFRDRNSDGEYGTVTIVYSDFRPTDGLQLPFSSQSTFNDQAAAQTITLDAISVNPPLDASLFAPGAQVGR